MAPGSSPEDLVHAAEAAGVTSERLLAAIRATPRAAFVPEAHRPDAYADEPVPIPHGQVTTQPSLTAMMVAALGLARDERVLEVGTGYGWQTALLARLAAEVVSVERTPDLATAARRNLAAQGIRNAEVLTGDGTLGAPQRAPFDAVLVSAAFPRVPAPLVAQLRAGGRLVQPVGAGGNEQVALFDHTSEGLVWRKALIPASFVRLVGEHGFPVRPAD